MNSLGVIKFRRRVLTISIWLGGISLALLVFFSPQLGQAAATSTVRGMAWWGDNGFLYFNCLDETSGGNLDVEGNMNYPPGFEFFAPPCSRGIYGVTIDANNNFRGQAWNEKLGRVSFSGTSTPPNYDFASNCEQTCDGGNECWACFNEAQKKIYGWAQVDEQSGSDRWIRLDSDFPIVENKVPVRLQTCAEDIEGYKLYTSLYPNNTSPSSNVLPGDFFGTASSPLGDLYFNCETEAGEDKCTERANYRVFISTLAIGSLSAPNFSYSDACSGNSSGLGGTLNWCVKSGLRQVDGQSSGGQAGYQIIINEVDLGPSPNLDEINEADLTCFVKGRYNPNNQYVIHSDNNCLSKLNYNTNYYWWIRLYYQSGELTDWYQYYGNTESDTDEDPDNNPKTFTTFKHKFPSPYFSYSPTEVITGEDIEFFSFDESDETKQSYYYKLVNGQNEKRSCQDGSCIYAWWAEANQGEKGSVIITDPTAATTTMAFNTTGSAKVELRVEDSDKYFCSISKEINNINYDLPIWREVRAP